VTEETTTTFFGGNTFTLRVPDTVFDWLSPRHHLAKPALPTTLLIGVKKVEIHLNYMNLAKDQINRKIHELQIRYLMEVAKILTLNPALTDIHFQFSEKSTALLARSTLLHLI